MSAGFLFLADFQFEEIKKLSKDNIERFFSISPEYSGY